MILKTARTGKYVGQRFYGCSNFPNCRETVDYRSINPVPPSSTSLNKPDNADICTSCGGTGKRWIRSGPRAKVSSEVVLCNNCAGRGYVDVDNAV